MNTRAYYVTELTRTFIRLLALMLVIVGLGMVALTAGWLWSFVPRVNESWGMSLVFLTLLAVSSILPLAMVRFALYTAVDLSGERVVALCRLLAFFLWLGLLAWAGQYWLDLWQPAWDLLVLFGITAFTAVVYMACSHLLTRWGNLPFTTSLFSSHGIGGLSLLFWLASTVYALEYVSTAEHMAPLWAIGLLTIPAVVSVSGYKIGTTLFTQSR